jgi:ribosomal protein S6
MEKESTTVSKIANKTDTSKIYELGYLLVSSLPEEKIEGEVNTLKNIITERKGEIIAGEQPILIDLAYSMVKVVGAHRQKYTRGYFGWIKFECESEDIAQIRKVLDLSPVVLRYMIIKTIRENTLLHGKMVLRKEEQDEVADMGEALEDGMIPEALLESTEESADKLVDDLVTA